MGLQREALLVWPGHTAMLCSASVHSSGGLFTIRRAASMRAGMPCMFSLKRSCMRGEEEPWCARSGEVV
jgi:hypothetical protein